MRLGGATHRLWLRELPAKGAPLVIELPLDADFDLLAAPMGGAREAVAARVAAALSRASLPIGQRSR